MCLPEKWQQMMFAQAEEFDIFHNNHLIIIYRKQRPVDQFDRIHSVTFKDLSISVGYPMGCAHKTFPLRVFAKRF